MLGERKPTDSLTAKKSLITIISFLLLVSSLAVAGLALKSATAQSTPYQVSGQIKATDAIYHIIYGVKVGDLVLVSVNPEGTNPAYWSTLYYPNITALSSQGGNYGASGPQSYQFIANTPGNYLLRFYTAVAAGNSGIGFNYTVKSSHNLSTVTPDGATPYKITGTVGTTDSILQTIYGIKAGDLVLVSITPADSNPAYWSTLYYPNITTLSSQGGNYGASGPQSYQFIANTPGNYLLKVWTAVAAGNTGAGFNYTIKSSTTFTDGSNPTTAPTATPVSSTHPSPSTTNPTTIQSPSDSASSSANPSQSSPSTISPSTTSTLSTQSTNPSTSPTEKSSTNPNQPSEGKSNLLIYALVGIAIPVAGVALFLFTKRGKNKPKTIEPTTSPQPTEITSPKPEDGSNIANVTENKPYDVFISYSTQDKKIADALCATLESRKIRCWIAPRDILPGVAYAEALIQGLSDSRILALVFSKEANTSPHVMREVQAAVSRGIPIIPFRIEDVKPTKAMEYYLSTPHWLDAMTPPLEKHLQELADSVQRLLAKKPEKPQPDT